LARLRTVTYFVTRLGFLLIDLQPPHGVNDVPTAHNCIPLKHAASAPAPDLHNYRFGDASATEIPCGSPAEVAFAMGLGERKHNAAVSLGRHKRTCAVCRHEKREEIEVAYIGWRSPAAIAEEYGLADRASVYRHANALGLAPKRQRNVRAALERIIEKACDVDVTASAVVAAIQAYAKINAAGEWIDRTETVSMNDLFERMSNEEMETYAQTGALPGWFEANVGSKA
jgi:hypothetical protein